MVTPAWMLKRFTMPVTVITRTPADEADEYGNVVYESVAEYETWGFLQPTTEEEIQDGRAQVNTMLLHLPAELATLVTTFSAFVVAGAVYEAIGPPAAPSSLIRSGVNHVEIVVQRSSS